MAELLDGSGEQRGAAANQLSWKPMALAEENINHFWLGLYSLPVVLDDVFKGSRDGFMESLLSPDNLFFEIGMGEGVVCCLAVKPGLSCDVYPIMFDKKLRGKEAVVVDILKYLFRVLKLERVGAKVAEDSETTAKFLSRVGFRREGFMKSSIKRRNGLVGTLLLRMLREDN